MARSDLERLPPLTQRVEPIISLTASRNMETVKLVIRQKYGIVVTDRFAQDLMI